MITILGADGAITPPGPVTSWARIAIALEVFLAIGALGGKAALLLGPRGEIIPLPLSALDGSPFADYSVPGAILFLVIGIGPLAAAALTWRRHRLAPLLACATGEALIVWLAVEIAIVGYTNRPPLQAFYLALGVAIVLVGLCWLRHTKSLEPAPETGPGGRLWPRA
jgi:hypothetical protein